MNLQLSYIIFSKHSWISLFSMVCKSLGRRLLIYSIVSSSLLLISFDFPIFLLVSIIAFMILRARGFTLPSTIVEISFVLKSCINYLWLSRKTYSSLVIGSVIKSSSFSGSFFYCVYNAIIFIVIKSSVVFIFFLFFNFFSIKNKIFLYLHSSIFGIWAS